MSKSRIFLFIMLCFIGGVMVRSLVLIANFYIFLGFGILTLLILGFSKNLKILMWCVMLICSFFGAWWYNAFEPSHFVLDDFIDAPILWKGNIVSNPQIRNTSQQFIMTFAQAPKEKVLIITTRYPEFSYGDRVLVSGNLQKPKRFDNFNYPQYLAKDDIYFLMRVQNVKILMHDTSSFMYTIFAFKKKFERNIQKALIFPHSTFVNGILLGSISQMPKEINNAFRITGVSHIMALSGYNITIIIIFVGMILARFITSRGIVFIASVLLIVLFVMMTGASPSVVRAAVMGVSLLLAEYLGRSGRVFNVLIFAACVMILFNPKILLFDLGFQLSFLAVLGLVYIMPYLHKKFECIPEFFTLKESFITTISAQIAVLPLVIYSFGQFSIIAPLVNMLVLPVMPFAMLFGFFTGIAGFITPFFAQLFAYPLWAIVSYQLFVINFFAQFSFVTMHF